MKIIHTNTKSQFNVYTSMYKHTHMRTMCVTHNPSADILHIWNKLPNYIRNILNIHIFTMMILSYIILYTICTLYNIHTLFSKPYVYTTK